MYENSEELTTENTSSMQTKSSDLDIAVIEAQALEISEDTRNLQSIQPKKVPTVAEILPPVPATPAKKDTQSIQPKRVPTVAEIPPPVPATPAKKDTQSTQSIQPKKVPTVAEIPPPVPATPTKKAFKNNLPVKVNKEDAASTHLLQEQCRQLCLQLFFREDNSVRSLGFTSSIGGEGKSLLALATAQVLAHDGYNPVTLVECNWEHPTLHECFDLPATPGLAEWLRGTCDENDIRYQIEDNLTVIPAGNGTQDAVKLLKQAQQRGLLKTLGYSNELLVVDLPAVITSSYGPLAASLVETVIVVVRSEVTPSSVLAETCAQLKGSSIHGIILNQENSRIPHWIRQLL